MPIREGRPDDLPSLLPVQATLTDPNPELLASALAGVGLVVVSTVEEGSPTGTRDRAVGYLVAIPGGDRAHVAEVAVDPGYRREGRATALLRTALDRLAVPQVTLAVEPDNDPARRCYEAVGFEVVERDPDYFDGDPGVVMAWSVDGQAEGDDEREP